MHKQAATRPAAVILLLLATAALLCAANLASAQQPAPEHQPIPAVPHYLRLEAPGGAAVYVKFHKDQLFVAPTLEGLQTAKAINYSNLHQNDYIQFPEIDLPFNKIFFSADLERLSASFFFLDVPNEKDDASRPDGAVLGLFHYLPKPPPNKDEESWSYLIRFFCSTGDSTPENLNIKTLKIPHIEKVEPEFTAVQLPDSLNIGIALQIKEVIPPSVTPAPPPAAGFPASGTSGVSDIFKNGVSVPVWIKVIDSEGNIVGGKKSTLQDLAPG